MMFGGGPTETTQVSIPNNVSRFYEDTKIILRIVTIEGRML
jgi:hypothetical protein